MQKVQTMLDMIFGLDADMYYSTCREQRELLRRLKSTEQALTTAEAMLGEPRCERCNRPLKIAWSSLKDFGCTADEDVYQPCGCPNASKRQLGKRIIKLEGQLSDEKAKLNGNRIGRQRDAAAHAVSIRCLQDEIEKCDNIQVQLDNSRKGRKFDVAHLKLQLSDIREAVKTLEDKLAVERVARQQDKEQAIKFGKAQVRDTEHAVQQRDEAVRALVQISNITRQAGVM